MDERQIASAVDRWARNHREELTKDLKQLIAVRSVAEYGCSQYPMGTECARAADCLMEQGRKYGIHAENDDYFCVHMKLPGKAHSSELGILGHLDVVAEGSGWKKDAFQPFEEKGYIFGRGSLDNKGPLTMALYVLRCMKELGIQLHSDVTLIAGCDEEKEMRDVAHYLSRHQAPDFTLICDGAWPMGIGEKGILEATLTQRIRNGNLLRMNGGSASNQIPDRAEASLANLTSETIEKVQKVFPDLQIERNGMETVLRIKGKTAHCSTPQNGENAILRLIEVLCTDDLLQKDAQEQLALLRKCFIDSNGTGLRIYHADTLSGYTTCVPTMLRIEEGVMQTQINVRYAVSQDGDILVRRLEERCMQLGLELHISSHEKPRVTDPEQPIPKLLLSNCHRHLSRKCRPYVTGGGTYARRFPNAIPYGPAYLDPSLLKRCGQPHGANECVSVEQLLEGIKIYVLALVKLDAYLNQTKPV